MLESLQRIARPISRIIRNALLLELGVLLMIVLLGRLAKWRYPQDYSFVLFFGGILFLIMAGFSASGSRHAPGVFGWGFSRYFTQGTSLPLQLLQKYSPTGIIDGTLTGLAGFLRTYAGPISIALIGITNVLIGAGTMKSGYW